MGFTDDSDNDLPDWLSELGSDQDDQGMEIGDGSAFNPDEDKPEWISDDSSGAFDMPEDDDGDVPDWLSGIREQEGAFEEAAEPVEVPDQDIEDDSWLENIRGHYVDETEEQEEPAADETVTDFLDTIEALKAEDEAREPPISDDEPTIRLQDYYAKLGEEPPVEDVPQDVESQEDPSPDWISGLPAMDFEDRGAGQPEEIADTPGEKKPDSDWLQNIRGQEGTVEEEPAEEGEETPSESSPREQAFSEDPKVTGSLPSWMETLQTSGLVLPADEEEEEELTGAGYSQEEISTLFEEDDLPDWLGSDSAPDTVPPAVDAGPAAEPPALLDEQFEKPIERAELPSWLQAMRPVEAVTSAIEEEEPEEEEEIISSGEKERVGPLSGLSDVLPAEPHIIHFGTPPKIIPGFELTNVQKQHAELLKSMVGTESAVSPTKRRTVANPQQILRWVIAILLLTFTFTTLWLGSSFTLPLPKPEGMPPENLALISLVNELDESDQVLVAVEYQPGLSGEMEAASSALIQHLLLQDVGIVLISSQPTGPGLGEAFLQENFRADDYIASRQYVNLGYVSGGAAGLLSFANDIRQTKAEMDWDQPPLNQLQSIKDFGMVVVLTDDPDVARSWVEQVQPLLIDHVYLTEVPLAMVVSAQAEPLVYPYYYSNPQQIAGLISGIGGGAYYETVTGPGVAASFWSAYNIGLVLAVIIIAVGSIYNLARTSLGGFSKGRS